MLPRKPLELDGVTLGLGYGIGFGVMQARSPLTSCVIASKLPDFSETQFPPL